jgi:outer membrane immunogenic protein
MRRAILAAVLLAFCADAASADAPPPAKRKARPAKRAYIPPPPPMPMSPPIPVRPLHDWSGAYVGLNVGGGWAFTHSDFTSGGTPFATAKNSLIGVNGGFQIGYNWQNGRNVFGVETDFQLTGQKGNIDAPPCPAAVCGVATSANYDQKMPWFGTVRARIGYASDTWMAFVTGGYAYAELDTDATATAGGTTVTATDGDFRSGWTVGGGFEAALDRHWSMKLEYLYMDFGRRDVIWNFTGAPPINDSIKFRQNLVRAGLNYRF